MNIKEAIKEVMKSTKNTYQSLADIKGAVRSCYSNRLTRSASPRCDSVAEMLDMMGAEVIVKDLIGKKQTYKLLYTENEERTTNVSELVKTVMTDKGYSYRALALKLGHPTPSYISEKVRGTRAMEFSGFVKIMNGMDCEVLVVLDKQKWVITE